MKPFRVLALDGGGMRILYTLSLLKTLVKHFNGSYDIDLGKRFDLIAGTSSGSLVATFLAYGNTVDEAEKLYHSLGSAIFTHPAPKPKKNALVLKWGILRTLWVAANESKVLKSSLEDIFHDDTLEDIYKRRQIGLCLNSVYMQSHDPKVFKTPHSPSYTQDNKRRLVDVCLASAAAPVLFPLALIPNPHSPTNELEAYCDGGIWACNPVLVALTEALYTAHKDQDIEIVSFGAGPSPYENTFTEKSANRGILDWGLGSRLTELAVDTQGKQATFIAQLLAQKFSELGRSIKVIRAQESWPDPEEVNHLGIDISTKQAFKTWQNLGEKEGTEMYKKSLKENSSFAPLKDIFQIK